MDLVLNGLIDFLHSALAFSEAKDSIKISLTFDSDTALFRTVVNLCKKSLKDPFEPLVIFVSYSAVPCSLTLSQAFKAIVQRCSMTASSR